MHRSLLLITTTLSFFLSYVYANIASYTNLFQDPNFFLNKTSWSEYSVPAQVAMIGASDWLVTQGPWAVTNKTVLPPTNNTHDYLSYAPYWWPDCSNVHNTTVLTTEQIETQCKYVNRDGQFVPDQHAVNNTGEFNAMADAIVYSAIAWSITGRDKYAQNVNHWIDTWFVNPDTIQTPNLNYSQLLRGVGEEVGLHTGVLDFKVFAKIATAVLTLRLGKAAGYTAEVDAGLKAWVISYLPWILNDSLAVRESMSKNNHATFYYNQLASLYLILDDTQNVYNTIEKYFTTVFIGQIDANGEQPYEAARTHPIHYRAYNLIGIITNARIGEYVGYYAWNATTTMGGTIQKAANYAIVQNPKPTNETEAVSQNYPVIAAMATVYGDRNGTYKRYLSGVAPNQPFWFWNPQAITYNRTITNTSSAPEPTGKSKNAASHSSIMYSTTIGLVGFSVALWSILL